MLTITKENIFKVLEWMIFLGLCCLSFYFMKGVLEQYFSNDTSFKHSEVMLKERPTIVICFTSIIENDQKKHFTSKYVLGKDFNITYQHENLIIGQEQKTKNVKEVETVILEKLPNTGSYGTCYVIVSQILVMNPAEWKTIGVNFAKSIPMEILPKIKFFISSFDNAFGIYSNEWLDGKIYKRDIGKSSNWVQIVINVEEYNYLKSMSHCNDYTFFDCYMSHLVMDDFKGCPIKCISLYMHMDGTENILEPDTNILNIRE